MYSSSVEQHRNATPSWSGYIHQGKVGFLVALRQLKKCIDDKVPNYENYVIRYENAEDFDIVDNNGKVISRHQVKAYIDGTSREQYSTLFNIQTRKYCEVEDKRSNQKIGKEIIDEEGFQIHKFDGQGNILTVEVSPDSRYLHVIVAIADFNLSRDEYLKKDGRRKKYTDNNSCIQLYPYNKENEIYHCPLSKDDENDTIKGYCIAEIKKILELRENLLKYDTSHFIQVYQRYVGSLLDHSIGRSHSQSGFPEICFRELLEIIEEETLKDEVYEMKNSLIYRWEKYHRDYASDISEEDFKFMDKINNHLLSSTKDEFYEFVRMMLPYESLDENYSELFRNAPIEDIFYVLLEKTKGFSFKAYSYLDDNMKSYRSSLISIQDRPGIIAKVIQGIIDNTEFLKATFNHDFLINRDIDELHIGNRIDELNGILDSRYHEEWSTGVQHNIFKPNMEFISIKKAKEKSLRVPED